MKLSTIFLVLAGTSQALVASTRSNNVDIDAGSHAMPLMSRSKIFSDQWFKEGWDKFTGKFHSIASSNAAPASRAKRHEMPDSADIPLLATATGPYPTATGLYPTATGLYPTATGAPMPTDTSTSSTEQGPANASLRRRTKHFYPKDLSIDYKLAPKAPVKV